MKGKTKLYGLIILSTLFVAMPFFAVDESAVYAARTTESALIEIYTAAELCEIVSMENAGNSFILKNDIDLNADTSWHDYVADSESGWLPLDTYFNSGTFDGGGFTIHNLTISRVNEYSGLFSKNSLNIKNLFFENAHIENSENAGILTGLNNGRIDNVHITSSIVAANAVGGGLIAENYGDLDNCSFDGSVSARTGGGLVGNNWSKIISNSYSIGSVSGQKIGGLVATAFKSNDGTASIETGFSFAGLTIIEYDTTVRRAGGLIATRENGVEVVNCYAGDEYPCVAFGDFNGCSELSGTKRAQRESFAGFDFDNYWNWNDETKAITQKTITISSDIINLSGNYLIIVGDKKYYNKDETARLILNNDLKRNVAIKSIIINGVEITEINESNIIEQEYTVAVSGNMYISFTLQYLIAVSVGDESKDYVFPNRIFFQSNEEIAVYIRKIEGYKKPVLVLGLGRDASFEKEIAVIEEYDENYYRVVFNTDIDNYTDGEVLFLSVYYEKIADYKVIIIVCLSILLGLSIIGFGGSHWDKKERFTTGTDRTKSGLFGIKFKNQDEEVKGLK
ncbi:MAG: hypothetical protein LBQ40_03445 [Clostridiales bacterium]|nr:hypothetical protein [Clostridiales bacterium]